MIARMTTYLIAPTKPLEDEATGTVDSNDVSIDVGVVDANSSICRAIDSIETIAVCSFGTMESMESMVNSQCVAANNTILVFY
jgi:hypothetical protein